MPTDTTKQNQHDTPGANPGVPSEGAGINPSAPTAGTEGWGQTSDERRVLPNQYPESTRGDQQKNGSGDEMAAAAQRAEKNATSNKWRNDEPDNPEDLTRINSGSAHSM